MSGFILDAESDEEIGRLVPNIDELALQILNLMPDMISIRCHPESIFPITSVCLQDSINSCFSICHSISEYHAHRIWYLEKCSPPQPRVAGFFMKYYLDYAVSMLYAAGEHLANALICFYELKKEDLDPYRRKRASLQSIVGHYLVNEKSNEFLTHEIVKLAKSTEWNYVNSYRDKWVHEQPPLLEGLGSVYKRKKRWKVIIENDKKMYELGIGLGDSTDTTIDELANNLLISFIAFIQIVQVLTDEFIKELTEIGVFA